MRAVCTLLIVAACRAAVAQQDDDAAALALADRTQTEADTKRTCVEYAEAAATDTTYSDPGPSSAGGRASLNIRCDGALGSRWRAVFSDRLDYFWARGSSAQAVNTLKEAYVSFRDGGTELLDLGRINMREGVGFAYNPSDDFRADAVRAIVSIDPDTLRDERLGTLMARSQTLWSSGSLTALYAPRVSAEPSPSTFSPDLGATNGRSRWALILSQRLATDFQPQLSLSGTENQSPQAGLNLTYLLNSATVAYVEWSGGRGPSNLAASGYVSAGPAMSPATVPAVPPAASSAASVGAAAPPATSPAAATAFHSRLSTGFTYTTPYELSVTLEYEYDGAAPGRSEWAAIRNGPVAPYVQYRQYAGAQAELAARQDLFGYAHWDDVGIAHLDLTAFVRFDPFDHSRVTWTEARYHWRHAGVALQWQRRAGDATSDFAPWPVRQSWLALIDYYF
jgi:hypothetical protein